MQRRSKALASDIRYGYCCCSSQNTKGSQRGRRGRRPRACSAPLPRSRHISEGPSSVCHVCVLEGHSQWTGNARRYLQHCQNPLPTQIYFDNACVRFADASLDPRIPRPAPEADSPCELVNDDLDLRHRHLEQDVISRHVELPAASTQSLESEYAQVGDFEWRDRGTVGVRWLAKHARGRWPRVRRSRVPVSRLPGLSMLRVRRRWAKGTSRGT